MKTTIKLKIKPLFTFLIIFFFFTVYSQKTKVVCIGASMTEGANALINYPTMLNNLLPSEYYEVHNLGVGGKTVIFGSSSWVLTTDKPDSLKIIQPDIVTILLGTNDSHVGVDGDLYETDYLRLIDSVYAWSAPGVEIHLALLPPVFDSPSQWGHDNTVIDNTINPKIIEVGTATSLPVVDLNTPFLGHAEYMSSDGVHPVTEGYQLLADLWYDEIRKDATSITVQTLGGAPLEITTESGAIVFEADFEPFDATHTDFVWTLEPITGNGILDGSTFIATENGTVKIVASNPEGGADISDEVIVTISGQSTNVQSSIESPVIFPNPATDYFTINNHAELEKVEIFNLSGEKVLESFEIENNIDISNLSPGAYLIKLMSKDKQQEFILITQ